MSQLKVGLPCFEFWMLLYVDQLAFREFLQERHCVPLEADHLTLALTSHLCLETL